MIEHTSASTPTATATLDIIVFGATGEVGRRVVAESARRGHSVSAVSRRTSTESRTTVGITPIRCDVSRSTDLPALIDGHDLVIAALRPPLGRESDLLPLTQAVVNAATSAETRFIVVGGAAALRLPDRPQHTVLSAPDFLPEAVRPIALACQAQHDWIMAHLGSRGTHVLPPAMLSPGERRGRYRIGGDTMVVDADGDGRISMEDFAVAIVDEAEQGRHVGRRFTVGY